MILDDAFEHALVESVMLPAVPSMPTVPVRPDRRDCHRTVLSVLLLVILDTIFFAAHPRLATARPPIPQVESEILEPVTDDLAAEDIPESVVDDLEDLLEEYGRRRLDLNKVERQDLEALRLITDSDIDALLSLRQRMGRFPSLEAVLSLPTLSATGRQVLSLIAVVKTGKTSTSIHRFALRTRIGRLWSRDAGFSRPTEVGPAIDTELRMRFLSDAIEGAITMKKDRYERFRFQINNRWIGFDHIVGYTSVPIGSLIRAFAGDFTVDRGQGLLYRGSYSRRATFTNSWGMFRNGTGIRGYRGSSEVFYFRGIGFSLPFSDRFAVIAFASSRRMDGRLSPDPDRLRMAKDSTVDLISSGIHVTGSQLERRRSIRAVSVGGSLEWRRESLLAGISLLSSHHRMAGAAPGTRGSTRLLGLSVYAASAFRHFDTRGEFAYDTLSGTRSSIAVKWRPANGTSLILSFFHQDGAPREDLGRVIGSGSTLSGRYGYFFSMTERIGGGYRLTVSFLKHRGWDRTRNIQFPLARNEFRLTVTGGSTRDLRFVSQFRHRYQERLVRATAVGASLLYERRVSLLRAITARLTWYHNGRSIVGTRLDLNSAGTLADGRSYGAHLYQQAMIRYRSRLNLTIQYAVFEAPGTKNNFYIYERDVEGRLNVPVLSDSGSRWMVLATLRMGTGNRLQMKYAAMETTPVDGTGESPRITRALTVQWLISFR